MDKVTGYVVERVGDKLAVKIVPFLDRPGKLNTDPVAARIEFPIVDGKPVADMILARNQAVEQRVIKLIGGADNAGTLINRLKRKGVRIVFDYREGGYVRVSDVKPDRFPMWEDDTTRYDCGEDDSPWTRVLAMDEGEAVERIEQSMINAEMRNLYRRWVDAGCPVVCVGRSHNAPVVEGFKELLGKE
jgi:hypothetical protein